MRIQLKEMTIDISEVTQLYPAAIIRYADGTVTPISLEWYDELANEDVELLHYAICVHYKTELEKDPLFIPYEDMEALQEGMADLAAQLNSVNSQK